MKAKASTKASNSNSFDLYDGFLRFNRRLLSILKLLRPPLSTNESHALAAIASHPHAVAKYIVELLGLEKSTVSRLLRHLLERDLIEERPSITDKRSKHLHITSEGARLLVADSLLRNREVEVTVAPLTLAEQRELQRLLRHMADTLGEPPVDDHPEDHPLKREIRRLTRGMGFIGPSCMRTQLPVEVCQVLRILGSADEAVPFSELNNILPYEVSALSRLVTQLSDKGLVEKQRETSDQRAISVLATAAGKRLDRLAHDRAVDFFQSALAGLSLSDVELLSKLVHAFTRQEFTAAELGGHGSYAVTILNDDTQRQRYRALLLEALVRNGNHLHVPESVLSKRSICVAIERNAEPVAVAEVFVAGRTGRLQQLAYLGSAARAEDEHTPIIESLLGMLRKQRKFSSLEIKDPHIFRSIPHNVLPLGAREPPARLSLLKPKKI